MAVSQFSYCILSVIWGLSQVVLVWFCNVVVFLFIFVKSYAHQGTFPNVKCYYNLKELYFNIISNITYSCDSKLNFEHHYSSLLSHDPSEIILIYGFPVVFYVYVIAVAPPKDSSDIRDGKTPVVLIHFMYLFLYYSSSVFVQTDT